MAQRKYLEEIETEVGRALAILNDDLEKLEQVSPSLKNASRLEEYRKTLEVLDNVLAEFDDYSNIETDDKNFNNENNVLDSVPTDDGINQNLSDIQNENVIPTTQLSGDNKKLLSSQKIISPPGTRNHPQLTSVSFVVQESKIAMWATESDTERAQQLRSKFQRVRELLKKNVITLLDAEPPSFIPPNPPPLNKNCTFNCDISELSDSSSSSSRQSPTVEDIPNLLPTDVLLRPQFGITYSLEEDLPPGVKEIQRTSTPKSNVSPTSSFSKEFGRLSTFSSQSEWEVTSNIPDKVPLTSFKSLTLPNGLDRFPFYTHEETSHWRKPSSLKSTSSLLPKEERETKKSHFSFRKFSRKSKSGSVL